MNTSETPKFHFTENEPTPIVKDFNTFVNYIEETPFTMGVKSGHIPYKHLAALNESMSSPNTGNTPRTPQRFYPRLHLFFDLALAGNLFQRAASGSSVALEPTDRLYEFRSLSDAGQYFFLLETLWVDCPFLDLSFDSYGRGSIGLVFGLDQFLQIMSKSKPGVKITSGVMMMTGLIFDAYLLLCFPIFGWYDFTRHETEHKSSVILTSLTPSHLGVAISKILLEERPFVKWNIPYRRTLGEMVDYPGQELEVEGEYVPFIEAFRKICADGESLDMLPRQMREHIRGNFVFKVSLGKVWRTIAISSENTLHDLHLAIQEAFRFDDDHLYAFYMDNRRFSDYRFEHPYSDDGPWADDAVIGDIDLAVNQQFLYLFDFGDEWHFYVTLVNIQTDEPLLPSPKILEQKGKSPEQYGRYYE
jgi:hypothetical protein